MYHVGAPPQQFPEQFEISDGEDDSIPWCVNAVQLESVACECFFIGDSEEEVWEPNCNDPFYEWFFSDSAGSVPAVLQQRAAGSGPAVFRPGWVPAVYSVNRVRAGNTVTVILDSGADMSFTQEVCRQGDCD